MKKVTFYTLGCKVNQYETNAMTQKFIDCGYEIVEPNQKPDIAIVNTCTVTNMSDRKSRQILRRIKQQNPEIITIAVGCYVQVAKSEVEKIEEIDLALGNNEKSKIVEYVEKYIENKQKSIDITDVMMQKEFLDFGIIKYNEKTRAVIKIQDGCDRFCSYCVIPYARGRVRSRKIDSIIEEINQIAESGIKEVVITGIHIASYGKDFKSEVTLIDLLKEINKIQGIERIRLGSLEPTIITQEFIEKLKKLEKICPHFHLSLQSGCDNTLKRMNRKYTTEQFKEVVRILRDTYDDVCLTTDIIVGFPGETEEEFYETYKFLEQIKFYKMHIFKYSPRSGTKAAQMKGQVDGNVKELRSKKLIELSSKNELEYNKSYIGKDVDVLFEEIDNDCYKGHTKNYILVKSNSVIDIRNKTKRVKIQSAEDNYITGIIEM